MLEGADNRMHIVLRLDANASTGFGHAVRSSALLQAVTKEISLVVAGDDIAAIRSVFPSARHRSVRDEGFGAILVDECPDVVIVDLPQTDPALWALARASGAVVVAVDDEGGAISADFVINGAGPESAHCYPLLAEGDQALTGPSYALLRPAFGSTCWQIPGDRSLSIVAGSGERARDWALMLAKDGFKDLNLGSVKMAVGAFFSSIEELRALCQASSIDLVQGLTAESMARFLASSQAALITGGMLMPETLAIGTPAIVFPQVENLVPEARWFAERRAVRDLGFEGGFDLSLIKTQVDNLLSHPDLARSQSDRGRALVDGLGARRCAERIEKMFAIRAASA